MPLRTGRAAALAAIKGGAMPDNRLSHPPARNIGVMSSSDVHFLEGGFG